MYCCMGLCQEYIFIYHKETFWDKIIYNSAKCEKLFSFKEILVMFQGFSDMKPRLTVYVYHFYSLVHATDCMSESLNL